MRSGYVGRKLLGLDQRAAARKAKLDLRTWRRMEAGKPTIMRSLHKIVHAFGFSYDWLMAYKRKDFDPKPFHSAVKEKDGSFLLRDQDTGKVLGRYTDIEVINAKLAGESRR